MDAQDTLYALTSRVPQLWRRKHGELWEAISLPDDLETRLRLGGGLPQHELPFSRDSLLAIDGLQRLYVCRYGLDRASLLLRYTPSAPDISADLTGDGNVTLQDATLALRAVTGQTSLTETQVRTGDLNRNGKIDLDDVMRILRQALGLSPGSGNFLVP